MVDSASEKLSRSERILIFFYRMSKTMYVFAPFLWALTITLLLYPYLAPFYGSIGIVPRTEVVLGIGFTFIICLTVALVIGYLYDRLELYRAEHKIVWKRNPFTATGLLSENQIRHIEEIFIPIFENLENEERVEYLRDCIKAKKLL